MAMRGFAVLALFFVACGAQAGEVFYRVFGQNSVVLGPICVPDVAGVVVDPAIDFNTSGLFITIFASGSATVFTYTGGDIDDGPDSVTWGAPAAAAIELDALANDCVRLHIRDEVFDVANSVEWGIKISDNGVLIMDHAVQVLAIDSAAVMAAAVHADLATGTPIPVNVIQISDDANADDTLEAWIDAAAVPSDLIKVNGTNAVSAAGRPEVNTTHFGGTAATSSGGRPEVNSTLFSGVATGSATLAAADDAVITLIGTAGAGLTNINLPNQTMDVTGTWTGNIVGTVSTLTTYTGNTLQTGDSFARIGAAGASLTAVDDAVITLIGTAGAGLTALPDVDSLLAALVLTPLLTADSGTTGTLVDAALTEATNNWFAFGAAAVFTSGTLARQVRCVTGFTASTDTLRFAPLLTTAVTTHTYYLIAAPGCAILGNP